MNWEVILWLILLGLFLLAEAATVTMVSLWFAAGSLAALAVSLAGGSIWLQIAAFLAVSAIMLTLLRPLARKYFTPRISRTNVDSVIGTTGRVTADICNVDSKGQVKLGAMYWTARSTDGSSIPEGTLVRADRIEGVKVFVSPVETEQKAML